MIVPPTSSFVPAGVPFGSGSSGPGAAVLRSTSPWMKIVPPATIHVPRGARTSSPTQREMSPFAQMPLRASSAAGVDAEVLRDRA